MYSYSIRYIFPCADIYIYIYIYICLISAGGVAEG